MNSVIGAAPPSDLGQTPQMGWNSWNKFHCDINSTVIEDTVSKIQELGLDQLGYKYVNIDDCWQAMERDADGHIQADPEKFPDGMKAIGDMIHEKELMFGIYSSAGTMTCQKRPGSLGYELMDAKDYDSWGVDYLKYDNCFNQGISAQDRYGAMSDALFYNNLRPIFYSICNWGNENVQEWGPTMANSWRTTQDIEIYKSEHNQWQSLKGNFLRNQLSQSSASVGHWNDPDMLQVGNGLLTDEEEQTHFALWAFAKAPLIIGCDLNTISDNSLAVLKSEGLIAINQNGLGTQAECVQGCEYDILNTYHIYQMLVQKDIDVYMAVLIVNWDDENEVDVVYDPIKHNVGVANGNCVYEDVYGVQDKREVPANEPQTFEGIKQHGHHAMWIKCLPW